MRTYQFLTVVFVVILAGLPAVKASHAQELQYPPSKQRWNADSLGNHRAVITVKGAENVAKGKILWRRRDMHPGNKRMLLVDAKDNKLVKNVYYPIVNRAYCILYFKHRKGHNRYYLYYMPYRHKGSRNYPKDYFPNPKKTANSSWLVKEKKQTTFATATLDTLEAVTPFDSFYPMELIATKQETDGLIKQHPHVDYLVFPEDRLHPIKMDQDLPYRWVKKEAKKIFTGTAKRGENYAFQLGIYAIKKDLKNVKVQFSSLKSGINIIPDTLISCLNTEGISYKGQPLQFDVNVPKGNIQAMWPYIKVPDDAAPGLYKGTATLTADNAPATTVNIHLKVDNKIAVDHGVNKPWKQTRLPWLNSTLAQKNTVISPYIPLKVKGNSISLLGRKVILSPSGLPKQIQTFFPIEMTSISDKPVNILSSPMRFDVINTNGHRVKFNHSGITFTKKEPGTVKWTSNNSSDKIAMNVKGHFEFDGFLSYQVRVIALKDVSLKDINLHIPVRPQTAKYFMGLGNKGGKRPDKIDWNWDVKHKNQDGGWIGTVNAGLKFSLRGNNYVRPLNTNFYLQKPLKLPISWGNNNKGGIRIEQKDHSVLVDAYSGQRTIAKGDTLYYDINLLITPFHPLYTDLHWRRRYYHDYVPVDSVKAYGANVINIHQGKYINPYINYPFIADKQLKAYIDSAHHIGMKVKIYNTVRELADRAYELYPLMSLGHEIFPSGKGGGYPWLQEHLNGDYIAGWYTPVTNDAAIVDNGMSRWLNYYVEGNNWLVKNVGIDGLYLDDVAFGRETMKRVKRVLLHKNHPGIIDLHSANQYDKRDGWNNSAILYMPLFPYINRLWFGEYFDYENNGPDFFMTEVSGIPYGLMGEMLQNGGNLWRGMLYGMTSRAPWSGDPRSIWEVWNKFGIQGSQMIGYWVPGSPVKTDNPNVLVTVYKKDHKALLSIASWAKNDTTIHLKINWKKLGIDPSKATLTAIKEHNFQPAATFQPHDAIPVRKNKGWLLILK